MSHTAKAVQRYSPRLELLFEMLQHKRPHKSKTEEAFIEEYLRKYRPYQDEAGNLIVRIEGPGQNICWSCHTDTVHYNDGYQSIAIDNAGIVQLVDTPDAHQKSNCLGADDSAGVWLATQMIEAGKPGLYIFHRGEENGGNGSHYIATVTPEVLDGIDAAIALDRYGYRSVITHQCGRCASDEFALSLAAALPCIPCLAPDPGGTFTDTRNYVGVIGECSNLSVGYFRQHTSMECLDTAYLDKLREALIAADTSTLVFRRKAEDNDSFWWGRFSLGNTLLRSTKYGPDKSDTPLSERASHENTYSGLGIGEDEQINAEGDAYEHEIDLMATLVENHPVAIAELLREYGLGYNDILDELGDEI